VPELPEIIVYIEALTSRIVGRPLRKILLRSPFLLRSVDPPIEVLKNHPVAEIRRIGKRVVIGFPEDLFLVIHLMIAGRLRWRAPGQKQGIGGKLILATLEFDEGTLIVTEAGSKKRASMHVVRGEAAVRAMDPGGVEPLEVDLDGFKAALLRESHTVKRTLTDPRLFSGIGNAFSDEILHAARLSPVKLTRRLTGDEIAALWTATRETLTRWTDLLRAEAGGEFPEKVTAFHPRMAVHGRFNEPCPTCGTPVQRIVYAENESNYCAICQTGGVRLADRSLSRLLGDDWPRRME
jgi:formamidopyrimidine-DNA glycosylase